MPVVLLLFAGCTTESSNNAADTPLFVFPSIATRAGDTYFDDGDEIGLTINFQTRSDEVIENHMMVYTGSYFESDQLTWYDNNKRGDFIAYYPYLRILTDEFSVKPNQNNTEEGHHTRSDLMLAHAYDVTPNANGVKLTFNHVMSLLVIKVNNESESEIDVLTVDGTKLKAKVDMENKVVKAADDSPVAPVIAYRAGRNYYRAIVVPQISEIEIGIVTESGSQSSISLDPRRYEQGKKYMIEVTLDKDEDLSDVSIISPSDVQDWELGDTEED